VKTAGILFLHFCKSDAHKWPQPISSDDSRNKITCTSTDLHHRESGGIRSPDHHILGKCRGDTS